MHWGNAIVRSITTNPNSNIITALGLELHLPGDVKATSKKITWLASPPRTTSSSPPSSGTLTLS